MAIKRVGVIGLGIMGAPMARNLAQAGYGVSVFNRGEERRKPFVADGVPTVGSPAALATEVDLILVMVTGPEALRAVIEGADGAASADLSGRIVVNASTVSIEATQAAAQAVEKAGGRFLDAPVSGSKKPAEDGQLVFLAGGEATLVDLCRPVLDVMGKTTIHCGAVGDGTRMKLTANLLLTGMMALYGETFAFGRAMGLPAEAIQEMVGAGAMAAPMFGMKAAMVRDRDYPPQFPLSLAFKDLNLVLAQSGAQGLGLPATAAVRECFAAAMGQGHADADFAAVAEATRALCPKVV